MEKGSNVIFEKSEKLSLVWKKKETKLGGSTEGSRIGQGPH